MSEETQVFPVHFSVLGKDLWLGWVSAEPWNYFVSVDGNVAWSNNHTSLLSEVERMSGSRLEEDQSFFDLDEAMNSLRGERVVDANLLVDIWNMFTDFHNTVSTRSVRLFGAEDTELYDALFANCDASLIIGLDSDQGLSEEQMEELMRILEQGREMLYASTFGRRN